MAVAAIPPNVTVVFGRGVSEPQVNWLPMMSTTVPPSAGPLDGLSGWVIAGLFRLMQRVSPRAPTATTTTARTNRRPISPLGSARQSVRRGGFDRKRGETCFLLLELGPLAGV